jgi:hypothetical protein
VLLGAGGLETVSELKEDSIPPDTGLVKSGAKRILA